MQVSNVIVRSCAFTRRQQKYINFKVFLATLLPLSNISKHMHMDMKWIIPINKTSSLQFILTGMGASDPLNNLRTAQSGLSPVS